MQCLQFPTPRFSSHGIIINKPFHLPIGCNDFAVKLRFKGGLKCGSVNNVPKHVAVIMDGNRRWAISKGMAAHEGHRGGEKAMIQLAQNCMKSGVKVVSLFAFSTENWVRPHDEVEYLMNMFEEIIVADMKELEGMRLTFLGNKSQLPLPLQMLISTTEDETKMNKGLHLVVAINYSGCYDITEATKKIATKVKDGVLQVEDIDNNLFGQHLETNRIEYPNPDLLIRTSGEMRLSNYMLWQLAYTEIFFSDKLFPDFNEADLVQAFSAFQRRQRRYGGSHY